MLETLRDSGVFLSWVSPPPQKGLRQWQKSFEIEEKGWLDIRAICPSEHVRESP